MSTVNTTLRRRASASGSDGGFTLIEAIAAITVAAIMLGAIAFASVTGIHASTEARINQQAGDVIESAIETARAQSYSTLVMSTSDPNLSAAKDSRILTSGCPNSASMCVSVPNPVGTGTVKEALDTSAATGYITNHIQTVTTGTNKVAFTVYTYITSPSDEAGAKYVRVSVFADWRVYGQSHERYASTYVTETTRGLPLPHFKLTPVTSTTTTVNPGSNVYFGFKLTNLGARDAWDFTASDETLGWSYYLDNGDGTFDPTDVTSETPMTDSSGNSVRDTGPIEPNDFDTIWVTRKVPATAATGSSNVTFTATSVAQPDLGAGTSTLSQSTTVTVSSAVITPSPSPTSTTVTPTPTPTATPAACAAVGTAASSGTLYYLHNTNTSAPFIGTSSTSLYPMSFSSTVPTASSLVDFSTDDGYSTSAGRNLTHATGSFSNTNAKQVASFSQQQSKNGTTYSGTTYLTVYAKPTSGLSTDSVTLSAFVGWKSKASDAWTSKTTTAGTVTGTGCADWRQFTIPVQTASFSTKNNSYIEVLLENTGSTDVRLAYDTTTYKSSVVWQQS